LFASGFIVNGTKSGGQNIQNSIGIVWTELTTLSDDAATRLRLLL
jgi:hypothetical protein